MISIQPQENGSKHQIYIYKFETYVHLINSAEFKKMNRVLKK